MNTPEKFCKAPFLTTVIDNNGTLLPCCEFMANECSPNDIVKIDKFDYWWNNKLNELRDIMINGQQHPACNYCISKEKFRTSHRQQINAAFKISSEFIIENYKKNKNNLEYPRYIELRMGNLCNVKCIMCGPYASSSILGEYLKNKKEYNELGIFSNEKTYFWWENQDVKEKILNLISQSLGINFAGGEPLINPFMTTILDYINEDCTISFNTNMTVLKDELYKKLIKFKGITLRISIDGIGKHNDYIRHGSNWEDVLKNIEKICLLKNTKIIISYILQHTSLYTLKNVLEWCEDKKFELDIGLIYEKSVDGSGHLTINSAPPEDYKKFKDWVESSQFNEKYPIIKKWLDSYKYDAQLNERFKKYMSLLDKLRNTNFTQTFLES
jgi:MoaA/NifB/PqqE/SkfB family radical SAM enzyme